MFEGVALFLLGLGVGLVITYPKVRQASRQAATDTLTGLYNRALLEKTLGRLLALAKRDKTSVSALMVDLNNFKEVNDRYGHQFGDQVLRLAAQAMAKSVRKSDFIFRYGGDEFLLILPQTNSAGAAKTANKIRENMNKVSISTPKGGKYDGIDSSIGIACFPENAKDENGLLKASDKALYSAKQKKDHVEVSKGES